MKRMIILLLALIPMVAAAQDFKVENEKVSWQCVFSSDSSYVAPTMDDIYKAIIYSDAYRDIVRINDNLLVAELKPKLVDVEDYGFKRMRIPLYLMHYKIGPVTVRFETREGRYRVTATNIRITNATSNFCPPGNVEEIEDYVLTDGYPNEQLSQYITPMYGKYFYDSFIIYPQEEEEW